jgi:hypothetical protein
VSVILPTYNRASFLPHAFESLTAQTFTDWDVILVDDGSTDGTREVATAFAERHPGRVRYVHQKNGGAYAARNRGLADATGQYIAFFDSDDLWLPHHLERCVTALESNAEVDWVFGASRQVNCETGTTIEPNTFFVAGHPRPFLALQTRMTGDLRIITDPSALECQIEHGLYCGLQNSVMRRRLFSATRFDDHSRVVDDEMFVIRVLAAGACLAYFMEPHVIYQVHAENSSGSAAGISAEKQVAIFSEMTAALEQLRSEIAWTPPQRRALTKRLSTEYFWHLGYLGLWQAGRRRDAIEVFERGLALWPWRAAAWKTYLLARLKVAVQGSGG